MSGIFQSIPASAEEVQAFGSQLTSAYLHCRVWGHDPDPQGNTRLCSADERDEHPGAYFWINPSCTHGCGVRWIILANAEGDLIRRALDYSDAPGYLSPTGRIDATGRSVLRKEYLVRATGGKPGSTRKRVTTTKKAAPKKAAAKKAKN